MEIKSLKERAEEARVQEEEKAQAQENQRRGEVVSDAISYFLESFPEVKYNTEGGKFELDGEFFNFQMDGRMYDVANPEKPELKNSYRLFPGDYYSGFHLGFSNLAGYGRYLKEKEKRDGRKIESEKALGEMTRSLIAKGRPSWKKLLFNIDG